MSGENVSEKLRVVEERLKEYGKSIGLPESLNTSEAEKYLNLSETELRAMSSEDCGIASLLLSRLAQHVQKAVNRQNAIKCFCEEEIWTTICDQVDEYRQSYQSYQERYYLAVNSNEYTAKLQRLLMNAKVRAEDLSFIAARVENQSDKFKNLSFAKRNQNN